MAHLVLLATCWWMSTFPDRRALLFSGCIHGILMGSATYWLEKLRQKQALLGAGIAPSASTPSGERKAYQLVVDEIRAEAAQAQLHTDSSVLHAALGEEQALLEARERMGRSLAILAVSAGATMLFFGAVVFPIGTLGGLLTVLAIGVSWSSCSSTTSRWAAPARSSGRSSGGPPARSRGKLTACAPSSSSSGSSTTAGRANVGSSGSTRDLGHVSGDASGASRSFSRLSQDHVADPGAGDGRTFRAASIRRYSSGTQGRTGL